MRYYLIFAAATIMTLFAENSVIARTKTIRETYTYTYSEDLSPKDAREAATIYMRGKLMSEVATYITGTMEVSNSANVLTAQQMVEAITAGVVPIVTDHEEFNRANRTFTANFEMRFDPDDIKEQLKAAMEDRRKREELAATYRQIKEAEANMEVLERQRDSLILLAQTEQQHCDDEERAARAKYEDLKERYRSEAARMDSALRERTRIIEALPDLTATRMRLARLEANIQRMHQINDSLRSRYESINAQPDGNNAEREDLFLKQQKEYELRLLFRK